VGAKGGDPSLVAHPSVSRQISQQKKRKEIDRSGKIYWEKSFIGKTEKSRRQQGGGAHYPRREVPWGTPTGAARGGGGRRKESVITPRWGPKKEDIKKQTRISGEGRKEQERKTEVHLKESMIPGGLIRGLAITSGRNITCQEEVLLRVCIEHGEGKGKATPKRGNT